MLSARSEELEKVRALRAGADDYVTKPFGRQELLARVETVLRRAGGGGMKETYSDSILTVDFGERRLSVGERSVELTPLEFKLLAAFVEHPNQLLEHGQLLELVWGGERGTSRDQVKLYVGYLRKKLARCGRGPGRDRDRARLRLPVLARLEPASRDYHGRRKRASTRS